MKDRINLKKISRSALTMLWLVLFMVTVSISEGAEKNNTDSVVIEKKPYLAKVGDEILLYADFMKIVDKLHQSTYVGEKLSTSKSFEKVDFRKFLDDKIVEMLIVHETKKLGLHKEFRFKRLYNTKRLNLCLAELRNEEILSHIEVSDKDIRAYFYEEKLKEEKEKYKVNKERLKKEDSDEARLKLKELKVPNKKQIMAQLDSHTYKSIRDGYRQLRETELQKKFFKKVFKSSRAKIDKKLLKKITVDNYKDLAYEVITEIHGEPIIVSHIFKRIKLKDLNNYKVKYDIVKTLITYKEMDYMALNRGYEDIPHIKSKLKAYEDLLLVKAFMEMLSTEKVDVSPEDVEKYYKNNKKDFRRPSRIHVNLMLIESHSDAVKAVRKLKKGVNFATLVATYSMESSTDKKGGDMGWVRTSRFPEKLKDLLELSKAGSIVGPFEDSGFFVVVEVKEIKKGTMKPFESVNLEIDSIIGAKLLIEIYDKYIEDLRNTVPIDIDYSQVSVKKDLPQVSDEEQAGE